MSERYLGLPIDIHGGGSDLVYPHHECETAQSEGARAVTFVRHWLHVAPVRLGAEKMSKSLGNMIFVRIALQSTTPQALRLYLFDVQYRRPFDHDETRLERSRSRAAKLAGDLGRGPIGPLGRDLGTRAVLAALDNDLNAPLAIRALECAARGSPAAAKPSLRFVARRILGIF